MSTVAYPGREGAHSAAACDRLFPDAELVPLPSFSDVVDATTEGAVDFCVLPIESSLVGPVACCCSPRIAPASPSASVGAPGAFASSSLAGRYGQECRRREADPATFSARGPARLPGRGIKV